MKAIPLSLMLAGAVAVGACERAADPPATATPGTFDRVGAQAGENDDWITTQVEARFYGSANVPNQIRVSTDEGVVTLRGRVEDQQAESEAVRLARRVDGVRDVRSEITVVDAAQAADRTDRDAADRRDPARDETGAIESAWITTKIQAKYFMEGDVKGRNIDVTTRNGVVTLSGSVENEAQRQEALRIARDTEGVIDVRDGLRIEPDPSRAERGEPRDAEPRVSDDELEARVQSRFYQNDDLRAHRIDVDVDEGVVKLSGEVDNEARRRQAVSIARNVDGVRDVRDELDVKADEARETRPGADRPVARDRDQDDRDFGDRFDDGWITTKVQAQFYLDTDLKGRDIDVTTRDGVVTLSGEVEGERQRQIAISTARETDGVRNVVDELRVVPSRDR
jgi:hyperosmotically inducible periplasmic protein